MLTDRSTFWGNSFRAELTRISAHGEKKLKLRRASLARPPTQSSIEERPETDGANEKDATGEAAVGNGGNKSSGTNGTHGTNGKSGSLPQEVEGR